MKKKISRTALIVVTVLIAGAVIAIVWMSSMNNLGLREKNIVAGVSEIKREARYIRAKDCPDSAYELTNSGDSFDSMCKAYVTDGMFVYYGGARAVPVPTMNIPVQIVGGMSSSSFYSLVKSQPKADLGNGAILLEGADVNTFEIMSVDFLDKKLDPKQNPTLTYARDKNFLYREGKKVAGADPDTLLILGKGYIRDENSMFFRGEKMEGADPETFEFLSNTYARDKNYAYIVSTGKKIENSDGKSFEILNQEYAKDSKAVYYHQESLAGVDPVTFEIISRVDPDGMSLDYPSGYTKDKNSLFYWGKLVEGADPATFKVLPYGGISAYDKNFVYGDIANKLTWIDASTFTVLAEGYYKDKNAVYYGTGKIAKNLDPATVEFLEEGYLKDKNSVWKTYLDEGGAIGSVVYMGGSDATTFQSLKYGYARDENAVYFYGENMPGATPESFEVIARSYAKDSTSAYYLKEEIEGVDAGTFEVVDDTYAKDKNFVYRFGVKMHRVSPASFTALLCGYVKDVSSVYKINYNNEVVVLKDADASTFVMLNEYCYAKDKKFVYYPSDGTHIEGADPQTFELLKGEYSKDKNSVYHSGQRIPDADVASFAVTEYGPYAKDKNTTFFQGKPMRREQMTPPPLPALIGPPTAVVAVPPGVVRGTIPIQLVRPTELYPLGL